MFTPLAQQPWSRASKCQSTVSTWLLSLAMTSFLFLTFLPAQAATPFTTNGNFNVGADGNASYSIPIQVPPGTAGMSPTLSLNYSSAGGNGMLGLGWGLDGLSQISRCPQTYRQDGAAFGVNFKSTDRFCLDGERLYASSDTHVASGDPHSPYKHVTTAAYGANGTEYRTENANFARIVSYGAIANVDGTNGPAYFKVWTKSGQIIEYGNTDDSRVEAAGKTAVRTWGVNKISDTKGNYLTVRYDDSLNATNGETYVSRIEYTGNAAANLSPYAAVEFTYVARPDNKSKEYAGGSVIKRTKRMTNIKTFTNGVLVKDYRITYSNIGSYSQGDNLNESTLEFNKNGSLITQITECDGATTATCLQPTVFTWKPGTVLNGNTGMFNGTLTKDTGKVVAIGDANGDGINDLLIVKINTTTSTTTRKNGDVLLALGTGSGFATTGTSLMTTTSTCTSTTTVGMAGTTITTCSDYTVEPMFLSDVNRDGKADIVWNNQVRLSNGAGFESARAWIADTKAKLIATGDINGDFMQDVVYMSSTTTSTGSNSNTYYYALSNGGAFVSSVLLGNSVTKTTCTEYTNLGTTCVKYSTSGTSSGILGGKLGDFDGDGKSDLITTAGLVYKSSGSSFESSSVDWLPSLVGSAIKVGDYDGNGVSDVIYHESIVNAGSISTVNPIKLGVSDTVKINDSGLLDRQSCAVQITIAGCSKFNELPDYFIKDLNYDGLGDLMIGSAIKLAVTTEQDYLTTISPGLGAVINITYNKLSDFVNGAPIYTTDYGTAQQSAYPVLDVLSISKQPVVSIVTSSNGVGAGLFTSYYTYGGSKMHLEGLGGLGFRWHQVVQAESGSIKRTTYRQDYPFIGMPLREESFVNSTSNRISWSELSYANSPLATGNAKSQFPYLTQSNQYSYELNGSLVSQTTTSNQYDTFGNVTQIISDSNDGHVKTTTNKYYNDSTNWILGRLLRSTVSSTNPGTIPTVTVPTAPANPPPSANVSPTVALTAPANNSSVASGTAITVSANAADSDGTISKVEFYDGATLLGTDTTSPYSISWTNAAVGNHTLTAKATDNGNAITTSGAVTVTITGTSTPPSTSGILSQGKPTSQSSTLAQPQRGEAYRAVDGNTNGAWQWNSDTNSLSHTASETESQAWWQVDLGVSATISQVKLWNRTECCGERLANFYVFVSTTDMTGRTLAQLTADSTVSKQQVSSLNGAASLVLTMGNVTGRYVRVQLAGTGYLSLAEVEVYGTTGSTPPPPANVNPTVSLTAPTNNGSVATGTAITVSANAADSDGSISKVEFYNGTTLIGTDTTSPYSISWSNAAVGAHSLTAKATDNANAVTTSAVVSFSVTAGSGGGTASLLSQGKVTTQSTTLQFGDARRAVDGNTNGAWQWSNQDATNSLSHTASETESQAWWQVDLGASATISQVKLWNRTDCCDTRLNNFYVFVSTTDMTGRTLAQLNADSTVTKQQVSSLNGAASLVLTMGNVTGRYVRVQLAGTGFLTLAEVQVYGQ